MALGGSVLDSILMGEGGLKVEAGACTVFNDA